MSDWCAEPPPSLLLKGIEQFNRGEFFAQHETLEELWRAETRDVRYLYQGILQIGVGLHHSRSCGEQKRATYGISTRGSCKSA